ncbi:MAG: PilN domain-containing protein [Acidaminococcaceae bacterium]|nr:PilN domain-containing protein [Acidaminococcaceae bacterium]
MQTVKLPVMTVEEQQNWVCWEGSQYVPFEPGTYKAALLFWPDSVDLNSSQENSVTIAADLSVKWQTAEKAKLQDYLLAAIPLEKIEALRQIAGFLKAKLEEVTVIGPKQAVLPVNLLPAASRKEVIRKRVYLTATVLCLFISMLLAVRGGISWQRAKSAWLEADRQLKPFHSVKEAYAVRKKTDYRIRAYQQTLQHINRTEPVWSFALQTIGKMIPEGCWLDELQQKQTKSRQLEIKGYALSLTQVTEFLDNLEHSAFFSAVRLVESGTRQIQLTNRGDHSKKVVSFLLVAELTPEREEGMP